MTMTIPMLGSTDRMTPAAPASLLGAACRRVPMPTAARFAPVDPRLYVSALEFRASLPGVAVIFLQTENDTYAAFGDGAAIAARKVPGVPLTYADIFGRRVAVASVSLDDVDDVRQALYEAGESSARVDRIDDAGNLAVTFISRPPAPPLDYVERVRLLRDAAKYLPRAARVIVAALLELDADAQRLAMRSIVAWLRNFDRYPINRLPAASRPALPTRAALGLFAELLAGVPASKHAAIMPLLRRCMDGTGSAPSCAKLRIVGSLADDVSGFDERDGGDASPVEAASMVLRAGGQGGA